MNRPKESGFPQKPFSEEEFELLPKDVQTLIIDLSEIDIKNPVEVLEMICRLDYENTTLRLQLSQIKEPLNYKIIIILSEWTSILNTISKWFKGDVWKELIAAIA